MKPAYAYEKDPAAIYRRSFAIIRGEADLQRFSPLEERVAVRIIHACGMVETARDLIFSAHAAEAAKAEGFRARQAAEACARRVLDDVGRALGATPFCRDAEFARRAADLPVFIRQSHAERDDAALGERVAALPLNHDEETLPWSL